MKILTKEDNFDEIISGELVVVDFFANWCGPCKMLAPNLEALSSEYNIVKVDVDELGDIARRYGIMSIPAIYVFKNGEVLDSKVGYQEVDELKSWLSKLK